MRKYLFLLAFASAGFVACDDKVDSDECVTAADCGTDQICTDGVCVDDPGTAVCTPLGQITNGTVAQPPAPKVGDTATYTCNTGYELDGNATRTCGASGTWSGTEPLCFDATQPLPVCPTLDAPENGSVTQEEESTKDDTAVFACDSDEYVLVGAETLTCRSNGEWDLSAPTCELCDRVTATSLTFAEGPEGDVQLVGFDLDDHVTEVAGDPKVPADGCGVIDTPGGIDNALGGILNVLSAFGLNVQGGISDLIGDSLNITTEVYENAAGEKRMDIVVNGTVIADDLAVTVAGDGTWEAQTETFVFAVENLKITEVEDPDTSEMVPVYIDITLTLNEARFRLDPTTGHLLVGGVLVYGDETTGLETFRPNIVVILDELTAAGVELPVGIEVVDSIFLGATDMALDGTNCVDLSFGMALAGTVGLCQ